MRYIGISEIGMEVICFQHLQRLSRLFMITILDILVLPLDRFGNNKNYGLATA